MAAFFGEGIDNALVEIDTEEVPILDGSAKIFVDEIKRVLKKGGKFYASVPASWPERICWSLSKEYQNQPGGHLRIFNQNQLVHVI